MPISKDELAQTNFGYLNGSDLMQFAPFDVLSAQYNKFPSLLQTGCSQAYAEMIGKLSDRYDVQKELSNSNQRKKDQTGVVSVNISAGSYISRITLSPSVESIVQIGTTPSGTDISLPVDILDDLVIWVNKNFPVATTIYFQIQGLIDFDIICEGGIISPPISIKEYLNQSQSFTIDIPANSYIYQIFANILLNTPSISIGTTLNGVDIVPLTLIDDIILPIVSNKNYFAIDTILYLTITSGSTDLRFDIGYNYIQATPVLNPLREPLFAQITSIIAIRNILGSISGDNTLLKSHFQWAYDSIEKIKKRDMSLQLESPPTPMESRAYMIPSNFSTIG